MKKLRWAGLIAGVMIMALLEVSAKQFLKQEPGP